MFTNTNYEAKLSPSITENWIVQIFQNDNSSIQTTNTPDLAFSFAETTFNNISYYPAIMNIPNVSYSLDLKNFTTKTGNVTLNLANVDIDGTTLLEKLGKEFLHAHVNILSQIDNDNTAANALQIFSGKISSFGYRNNTIVVNIISARPFQNVTVPTGRTSNTTNTQYNNKIIPLVYGNYTANTGLTSGANVYGCPFLKNDGSNFIYIIPEGTAGSEKLEFYDKGLKRFLELRDTIISPSNGVVTIDSAKTVAVPKAMVREFDMLPDDIVDDATPPNSNSVDLIGSGFTVSSGSVAQMYDGDTLTSGTVSNTAGWSSESKGFVAKLILPQVTGKITAITLNLSGTYSQVITGSPAGTDGAFFNLADNLNTSGGGNGFGSSSGDVQLVGTSSSGVKTDQTNTALPTTTNAAAILDNNTLPQNLYLSFRFNAEGDNADYSSANVILKNIYFTITAENDLQNEPVASTTFNAGVDIVYLGRDVLTPGFTEHTSATTIGDLNNPVAIHRQLLHDVVDITDFVNDTDIEDSGFKEVAELRDSNTANSTTHWDTKLSIQEKGSLENVLTQLQYEGCFFFQFSPQAEQTALTGVSPLRYFTIDNGVPTADVALSQNDISNYELGITRVSDLETNIVVNYQPHPTENDYLQTVTYTANTSAGQNISHNVVFDQASHQKQEINLDYLRGSIDAGGSDRNDDFINFRSSLFGDYKTTINVELVNPEKYAMLQIGDIIDFSSILFQDLGEPFASISDTFDSFVAMPTNLFKETWSNKRFLITNLKRTIGKVSINCRQV